MATVKKKTTRASSSRIYKKANAALCTAIGENRKKWDENPPTRTEFHADVLALIKPIFEQRRATDQEDDAEKAWDLSRVTAEHIEEARLSSVKPIELVCGRSAPPKLNAQQQLRADQARLAQDISLMRETLQAVVTELHELRHGNVPATPGIMPVGFKRVGPLTAEEQRVYSNLKSRPPQSRTAEDNRQLADYEARLASV